MIETIDSLLASVYPKLSADVADRLRRHLFSQLVCLGRHTVTGLLTTQGRLHQDWSADYRLYSKHRVKSSDLFDAVTHRIDELLPAKAPLIVAMDDSLLRKTGRKTPGCRWMRDPLGPPFSVNFVRAQRVLQFSAAFPDAVASTSLNPLHSASARLIPIDFAHVPPGPKIPKQASAEEIAEIKALQKKLNINQVAAERLEQLCSKTSRSVVAVSDGRFANKAFLRDHPDKVTMICRIRKDSALFYPPDRQAQTGRKRLYGEDAPTPEQLRTNEAQSWQRIRGFACGRTHLFKIKQLQGVVSPLTGARKAQVIVIAPLGYRLHKGGRIFYRQPAFLMCTDPDLSVQEVLQYYLWRWDIEVNFRDEKTLLGVGQAQVRNEQSAHEVPATAVAAYALLLLAGAIVYPPDTHQDCLPRPAWRQQQPQRTSSASLINLLRFEMFAHSLNQKSFRGFCSKLSQNQKPSKLPCDLPSSLFYALN